MTCGYEAPTWAHYPDGRCIDGYLWDLDSGDGEYLTSGGDVPCPCCNAAAYVDYCAHGPGGNSRQRRRWRRVEARKCRAWAIARSTFPCGVPVAGKDGPPSWRDRYTAAGVPVAHPTQESKA